MPHFIGWFNAHISTDRSLPKFGSSFYGGYPNEYTSIHCSCILYEVKLIHCILYEVKLIHCIRYEVKESAQVSSTGWERQRRWAGTKLHLLKGQNGKDEKWAQNDRAGETTKYQGEKLKEIVKVLPHRSERGLKVEGVPKVSNGQSGLFLTPNNTKVVTLTPNNTKVTKNFIFSKTCAAPPLQQTPVLLVLSMRNPIHWKEKIANLQWLKWLCTWDLTLL